MLKKLHLLIILFGLSIQAQNHVSGIVKDSKTKEVLAFASIILKNNSGLLTDANGLFNISSKYKIDTLIISYVGYKTKTVIYKKKKYIEI